jgi:hypothetical protein
MDEQGQADAGKVRSRGVARVLRGVGLVVMVPMGIALCVAGAVAWLRFDPQVTDVALTVAAFVGALFLGALVLLILGSLVEFVGRRRWPSVGGLAGKVVGVTALIVASVTLLGLLGWWAIERGDVEGALAKRLLFVGLGMGLAGGALVGLGGWLGARTAAAGFAAFDGATAAALLIAGFMVANPWAVGLDLDEPLATASAPREQHDGRQPLATGDAVAVTWFNGTISVGARNPVTGGLNGPGSDSIQPFAAELDVVLVIELRWDAATQNDLVVILERDADGAWEEIERSSGSSPLIWTVNAPAGDLRTRVFLADEIDVGANVQFTQAVSQFEGPPPEGYSLLHDG